MSTYFPDISAHRKVDLKVRRLLVEFAPHHVVVGTFDDEVLQLTNIAHALKSGKCLKRLLTSISLQILSSIIWRVICQPTPISGEGATLSSRCNGWQNDLPKLVMTNTNPQKAGAFCLSNNIYRSTHSASLPITNFCLGLNQYKMSHWAQEKCLGMFHPRISSCIVRSGFTICSFSILNVIKLFRQQTGPSTQKLRELILVN